MSPNVDIARLETGVPNLDGLLGGGLPRGAVTIIAGPPGAGKTILTQQICFWNAASGRTALYFSTLSEPIAKSLRYLSQLNFFEASRVEQSVQFVDLGVLLRTEGLEQASRLIMEQIRAVKPAIVVIDSFKVFDDLARSPEELRKFGYELAVQLMVWEVTALLVGEYGRRDIEKSPLSSVVDGLILMSQRERFGEQQRLLQVVKMRGTDHGREEYPFLITRSGIELFAPCAVAAESGTVVCQTRCRTGISKLDELLGPGIPRGSSVLVAGSAGTGKTALLLEFIYRGSKAGERGIVFAFEQTREHLLGAARGFGWDLEAEIERGMIEIVVIPQSQIQVDAHLRLMRERIAACGAQRVAIDSISVFLRRVQDAQAHREKLFQIAGSVQSAAAVGLFAADIPYGSQRISRFGIEETAVDGVILLSSVSAGLTRRRYLEIYKLRNTAHSGGRHGISIGGGGIDVFPRSDLEQLAAVAGARDELVWRLGSGVPGLDEVLGGGLLAGSATLISGSAGVGKTTLGLQFLAAGAQCGEPGLCVAFGEPPLQLRSAATGLGLSLEPALQQGLLEILHVSHERFGAESFPVVLAQRMAAQRTRRLVLDGVSQALIGRSEEEMRRVFGAFVLRLKALGVTSLLTFEAPSLFAVEPAEERGLVPLADNLIMLRYVLSRDGLQPALTVVKTRGSAHARGTHALVMAAGGLRLGARLESDGEPRAAKRRRAARRSAEGAPGAVP